LLKNILFLWKKTKKMKAKPIKTNIKNVINRSYMTRFFAGKVPTYWPERKLKSLKLEVVRNFLGMNETVALKFTLKLNNNKGVIFRGSATSVDKSPRNTYLAFSYLNQAGYSETIPKIFDYDQKLNLQFYQELPGTTIQSLIDEKKIKKLQPLIKQSAGLIKKVHQIKPIGRELAIRTRTWENREHLKEVSLVKKCYKLDKGRFLAIRKEADQKRKKWLKYFYQTKNYRLNHGDYHPGNVIVNRGQAKVIDFSAGSFYEPTFDISRFLIQLEMMLRYHFSDRYLKIVKPLRASFCKVYYKNQISRVDQFKIKYYEIQHLLQIMSIIAFIENKQPYQETSMEAFYKIAESRLKKL